MLFVRILQPILQMRKSKLNGFGEKKKRLEAGKRRKKDSAHGKRGD